MHKLKVLAGISDTRKENGEEGREGGKEGGREGGRERDEGGVCVCSV